MSFAGRSVLVTGAAGFLGGHVARGLAAQGARVRGTVHEREPQAPVPGVAYERADLRSLDACRKAVEGAEVVFHFAANTSGAAVMARTPLVHVTPNVVMNAHLLEAAYESGVSKFVFPGSGAAYPSLGRPAREDDLFAAEPDDVYYAVAWMKRYTEILCRTYSEKIPRPMPCVVVRPSNAYGPGDKFDPGRSHVTAALLRKVAERQQPLEVWGTGEDVRDLIYVDDLVEGILKVAAECEGYAPVNLASGQGRSVKEILRAILEADGWSDAEILFDPSKPSTVKERRIDPGLARERHGWEARTSLHEGLRRTLAWFRSEGGA